MKMRVGKKLYVIIFCSVLFTIMFILIIFRAKFTNIAALTSRTVNNGLPFSNSPFDRYDFTDCKIGVIGDRGEIVEYLTKQQINKFVEILLQVEVNKYGISDYPIYAGKTYPYRAFFGDGEAIDIVHLGGPYLLFGKKAYKCYNDEALSMLDSLGREAYRENYSDKD